MLFALVLGGAPAYHSLQLAASYECPWDSNTLNSQNLRDTKGNQKLIFF